MPVQRTAPREAFKLKADQVVRRCDPSRFPFSGTEEVPPLTEGIIGQPRAVEAMEFGLAMATPGYNLFLSGPTGTGKTTYAETKVNEVAKTRPTPSDWCYVHNFDEPDHPTALAFPPGMGAKFRRDMEELIEEVKAEIRRAFDSEEYESRRLATLQKGEREAARIWQELEEEARARRFIVQRTPTGILTAPLTPLDKPYTQEQFAVLPDEHKEQLGAIGRELQGRVNDALRRVRQVERATREALRRLERETGHYAVDHLMQNMKDRYSQFPKVVDYLNKVQEDIIEHLHLIRADGADPDEINPLQGLFRRPQQDLFLRYRVNLLVSHSQTKGAPVVVEPNPTYYNLLGKTEYQGELGTVRTNFTMIKPGALHRANGGYLILQARDLLMDSLAWPALKRCLKMGQIRIENLADQYSLVATTSLRPEAIPLDVKVILIGNPLLYYLLYAYDEDFRKYFKVKVDFDTVMPRTPETEADYCAFISNRCRLEGLPPFDPSGVARVIEFSSRLADHQEKLSTRFNEITEIVAEAGLWARRSGSGKVRAEHVQQALEAKRYRSNQVEERILEMIQRGSLLVDVDGAKVGQINGIAILQLGDYAFGKPARITARAYLGNRGVINIEREADLSGRIHSKGVLILSSYLAGKYAQDKPLSLSASLAFEQSYDEVEGDSASSAELYALLSELSGVPIDQGIAVTGSINQKGEVQPIGGVNEKIEGFYHVCKLKGLTGRQGVLIPKANVENLMLKDEVVAAIEAGQFSVWAVSHVDEAMEILTGVPAGEPDEEGRYPEGTINYLVEARLTEMAKLAQRFGRDEGEEEGDGGPVGGDEDAGDPVEDPGPPRVPGVPRDPGTPPLPEGPEEG